MQYHFFQPTKITTTDKLPVNLQPFEFESLVLYYADGARLYYDNKQEKARYNGHQGIHVWAQVSEGNMAPLFVSYDLEAARQSLQSYGLDLIKAKLEQAAHDIASPAEYEAARAAEREERAKQEAQREEAARKREEEEEHQAELQLKEAEQAFKAGQRIDWEHFEELCKRNGVSMHMRTIGQGRDRIRTIGPKNAQVIGRPNTGKVWEAVRELGTALNQ